MKTISKITLSLLLIAFAIGNVTAQKKYDLKYKLKVNDKYEYVTELSQDISFDANGQTMTLDQEMTITMEPTVAEVTKEEIKQDITFEKLKMTQSIFGMEII